MAVVTPGITGHLLQLGKQFVQFIRNIHGPTPANLMLRQTPSTLPCCAI